MNYNEPSQTVQILVFCASRCLALCCCCGPTLTPALLVCTAYTLLHLACLGLASLLLHSPAQSLARLAASLDTRDLLLQRSTAYLSTRETILSVSKLAILLFAPKQGCAS